MKIQLVYKGIKHDGYFFDVEEKRVYGPRGLIKSDKNGTGCNISSRNLNKTVYISYVKLEEELSKIDNVYIDIDPAEVDKAFSVKEKDINTPVVDIEPIDFIKVLQNRVDFLKARGLEDIPLFVSEPLVIAKAHEYLDSLNHYELEDIHIKAESFKKRYAPNTEIGFVVEQVAARIIMIREEANTKIYEELYNDMSIDKLRKCVSKFMNPELETFVVKKWLNDIRRTYSDVIGYSNNGIRLINYPGLNIKVEDLEGAQTAYKLLTQLYGWRQTY